MTEIERVQDTPPPQDPQLEMLISEWATGQSQELMGVLRQMRVAFYVVEARGRAGVDEFTRLVGAEKSKVYAFAACYRELAAIYDEPSKRLESSPLTPWILAAAVKRGVAWAKSGIGDVESSIARAEEGQTYKEINAEASEAGKAEAAKHTMTCPTCHGSGEVPAYEEMA